MDLLPGILVYFLLWWVALFMVLPLGAEADKNPKLGHARSAPRYHNLGIKIVITSVIAAIFWCLADWIITYDLFNIAGERRQGWD